jgi:hypothetical protein
VACGFAAARSRVPPVAARAAAHQAGPDEEEPISATFDRAQAGDAGTPPGSGGATEPADLAALAWQLRERERRALLECDEPAADRILADAAAVQARLEDAAAGALARGHSLAGVSAAALPAWDARARFEAMGRLAATCARVAEVREMLLDEARALGGEVPADHSAQLKRALSRTRRDLHAAVRDAVVRAVAARAILDIARAAGLDLEEGDLTLAFEGRGGASR